MRETTSTSARPTESALHRCVFQCPCGQGYSFQALMAANRIQIASALELAIEVVARRQAELRETARTGGTDALAGLQRADSLESIRQTLTDLVMLDPDHLPATDETVASLARCHAVSRRR